MDLKKYKLTGTCVTLMTKVLGMDVRGSGLDRLPVGRPVMFVVNHFTRTETFLLPWVLWQRFGRPVRSLATPDVFHGRLGRYLDSIGVLSTGHPQRNRIIVGDLMTKRVDWVIYPEGGLVKSKKTVQRGRLRLDRPQGKGRPHTGAAMLALQAETRRRRYLEACEHGNDDRMRYYESTYDLTDGVSPRGIVIVPVSITFPHPRAGENLILRVARLLHDPMHPHLEEELELEGRILMSGSEISVHFGAPIDIGERLERKRGFTLRRGDQTDPALQRRARRLTRHAMRSVYAGMEINLEHLFCYGLHAARRDQIPVTHLRKALYLAVMDLRQHDELRLHRTLLNGISPLLDEVPFEPLEHVANLAAREGVLARNNGHYVIDRAALDAPVDFHEIRRHRMTRVIANELEPIEPATDIVRDAVNLRPEQLDRRLARAIHEGDRAVYRRAYHRWHQPLVSKPRVFGEPYMLLPRSPRGGVVLVHGYLSAPEQLRRLGERLYERGFAVYGVRLDGHGTAPENLSTVTWQDWMESARLGLAALRHRCERVFVGGFSLGGNLALMLAAEQADAVAGVFAINAPMRLRTKSMMLAPGLVRMHAGLLRLGARINPPAISTRSECPDINYPTTCLRSVLEVSRVMHQCARRAGDVVAPALLVQSDDDQLIARRSASRIAARLGSRDVSVEILPGRRHVIVRGPERAHVFDRLERFLERLAPGGTPPIDADGPTASPERPIRSEDELAGAGEP